MVLICVFLMKSNNEHFFMFVGLIYVFFHKVSVHVLCSLLNGFFFFKQKTAYEMESRDWSPDVSSSDLSTGPSM